MGEHTGWKGIPSSQSGIETERESTRQVWKDGRTFKGTQEDLLHKSKDQGQLMNHLQGVEGSTEDIGDRDSKISKTWGVTEELKVRIR